MNKVTGFASPGIVNYCIAVPLTFWIISTALLLIFSKPVDFFLVIVFAVGGIAIFLLSYMLNINAFVRYEINESGIKNKYVSIDWENIESVVWFDDIVIGKYKRPKIEVAAVLGINGKEGSFYSQNPKKCVFLTKNKKNFDALRAFGRGKSEILDKFLDMYE